jgi:hypothetical protein
MNNKFIQKQAPIILLKRSTLNKIVDNSKVKLREAPCILKTNFKIYSNNRETIKILKETLILEK